MKREINGMWSTTSELISYSASGLDIGIAKTSNGVVHVFYSSASIDYPYENSLFHRAFDGANWSSPTKFSNNSPYTYMLSMSSMSNDIYIIWLNVLETNVKYLQYDANPLVPQNLSVTNVNGSAVLTWSENLEPDVRNGGGYKIYRARTTGGVPTSFDSAGWVSQTIWTDPDMTVGGGNYKVFWKISATDKRSLESASTNYVWLYYDPEMQKISIKKYDYSLSESYPNPFNPTTKIKFTIPSDIKSEKSNVKLIVFDLVGRKIATLVNESKSSGEYEVEFNADKYGLSSGVYFYQLNSGNYTATKKFVYLR